LGILIHRKWITISELLQLPSAALARMRRRAYGACNLPRRRNRGVRRWRLLLGARLCRFNIRPYLLDVAAVGVGRLELSACRPLPGLKIEEHCSIGLHRHGCGSRAGYIAHGRARWTTSSVRHPGGHPVGQRHHDEFTGASPDSEAYDSAGWADLRRRRKDGGGGPRPGRQARSRARSSTRAAAMLSLAVN
jgi:hypothetical protein